ncbi:hypothetical protein BC828DRAFT_379374, partial [Blastocladiella britannica]
MTNLTDLPDDILGHVPRFLDLVATVRLRSTCRALRNLPALPLTHPKLSVLVSSLEGDVAWFTRALAHPALEMIKKSDRSREINNSKVAELLVRFRVPHRPIWLALATHSLGDHGGNIKVSRLLVAAALENAPEMLPLVTLVDTPEQVPELATLTWQTDDHVAERVYAVYEALYDAEHESAETWRDGLNQALFSQLGCISHYDGRDWISEAYTLRGIVNGKEQEEEGESAMTVLQTLADGLEEELEGAYESLVDNDFVDMDHLPESIGEMCPETHEPGSVADMISADGSAIAHLCIGRTLAGIARLNHADSDVAERVARIAVLFADFESKDTGALWGPEMVSFLLNNCFMATATAAQTQLALEALGTMILRASDLPHGVKLRMNVLVALLHRFNGGSCVILDEKTATSLARVLHYALRDNKDEPFALPMIALLPILGTLLDSEHANAVGYSAKALGHALASPLPAVVEAALSHSAVTKLASTIASDMLPARRGTMEALAEWIGSGNHPLRVLELDLLPTLIAQLKTETDHWVLRWGFKCLHRASKQPLLMDAFLADPDMVKELVAVSVLKDACFIGETLVCCMRRAQLRLICQLATVAAAKKRFDTLVALFDGGLLEFLSKSMEDLNIINDSHYEKGMPLLTTLQAYFDSGVDADLMWGARTKIGGWCGEMDELSTLLEVLGGGWCASKQVKKLARKLEERFEEDEQD